MSNSHRLKVGSLVTLVVSQLLSTHLSGYRTVLEDQLDCLGTDCVITVIGIVRSVGRSWNVFFVRLLTSIGQIDVVINTQGVILNCTSPWVLKEI